MKRVAHFVRQGALSYKVLLHQPVMPNLFFSGSWTGFWVHASTSPLFLNRPISAFFLIFGFSWAGLM